MRSSVESIYQAICQLGSLLMHPSPLAPRRLSPLRTGGSPTSPATRQPASATVQTAAALDPRPPLPLQGRSRALGRRPDHRQGPTISDRHARGTSDPPSSVASSPVMQWRRTRRSTPDRPQRSTTRTSALDHVGSGHRNGTPPDDRRHPRHPRLLLRLALTVATRHE